MERALLERYLDEGLSLAEIGRRVDLHEATVGYWVKKHRLEAANHGKHLARGGLSRDELELLVDEGKSIAQIAEAVGRGKATVRHWLQEYGLRTMRAVRRDEPHAPENQLSSIIMRDCPRHGPSELNGAARADTDV